MNKSGSTLRGVLLIAGTSIGGGMLALPVLTSLGGFVPSIAIYFACWVFMACTGLLFLEICHALPADSNIVTMAEHTLGFFGKAAAWILYLFLFNCLTLAYVVGCGRIISESLAGAIPSWIGPLLFVLVLSPVIYIGTRLVSKINVFLMLGLGLSFTTFILVGYHYVKPELLLHADWSKSLIALPITFAAFAYQGTVPTLVNYLNHDKKKTRIAVLGGSFITFIVYIIWQWLILGIVPVYGAGGLAEALENGQTAVAPLKNFVSLEKINIIGQSFAIFAMVTSFLGVSLGLIDFLADGLKIKKDAQGKVILCSLVFAPALVLAWSFPHVFLTALDYAGGIGCALLLGLMPILMVWNLRSQNKQSERFLPGGKVVLVIMTLFVVFELICELIPK